MSAYEAERLRDVARDVTKGISLWPWEGVIATYLFTLPSEVNRLRREEKVMAALLAAELAQRNRRGNWHDYRIREQKREGGS